MNIARLVLDGVDRFGEFPAVCHNGVWSTNVEELRSAERLAAVLHDRGVRPGDRVVVMMVNGPAVMAAFHAVWRLGAIIVPVMPQYASTEAGRVIVHSGAQFALTSSGLAKRLGEATAGLAGFRALFVFGPSTIDRAVDVVGLMKAAAPSPSIQDCRYDEVALLVYTSGTLGRPKAVMLSHGNLWANAQAVEKLARGKLMENTLDVLPLSHVYGVQCMNHNAISGSRSVILSHWDTRKVFEAIQKYRVQRFAAVPTMLSYMIGFRERSRYDCTSLKFVGVGGAPTPDELRQEFERVFGCRVKDGYGCSEATGPITSYYDDEPHRAGSVGRPIEHMELTIRDAQASCVPAGEEGEICVRGPHVMQGYWNDPGATEAALLDGWLHTGDLGKVDADGYVYVTGRRKDLIIKAGENISPREIEEAACHHPAVAEAAIIGLPNAVYGEDVCAVIVLRPGRAATAEEIKAHIARYVTKFKVPSRVFFRDRLPKNPIGKILKRSLREEYAAKLGLQAQGSGGRREEER